MIMQAGTSYALKLVAEFNQTLDGVYTVVMTTTFEDALASGVSFVDKLYTPGGLTESNYNTDYNTLTHTTVYVCANVTDPNTVIYVPEPLILGIPDPTVKAYNRVFLIVDVGYVDDVSVISPLISLFNDQTVAYLGVQNAVTPSVDSTLKKYMTSAQYAAEQATLDANKTAIPSLTAQIISLTSENQDLRDRLAAYEQAVIAASKG